MSRLRLQVVEELAMLISELIPDISDADYHFNAI